MNEQIFEKYCKLIYNYSGITLNKSKQSLLENRIGKRLLLLRISPEEYYELASKQSGDELTRLIDAITTNVTYFFRDEEHFDVLKKIIVNLQNEGQKNIRIWCAACSTGEEPYSIAMACLNVVNPTVRIKILATDINKNVINHAKLGVYKDEIVKDIDKLTLKDNFLQGQGDASNFYKIKPKVQELVQFGQINLIDHPFPLNKDIDMIFCRNVMIYFDTETRERIVSEFYNILKPSGYLFTSLSESLRQYQGQFENVSASVGRKK